MSTSQSLKPQTTRRSFPVGPVLIGSAVVVLLLAVVLFRPAMRLVERIAMAGTSSSVPSKAVAEDVAFALMQWKVFGPRPKDPQNYTLERDSIARRVTGVRGYTQSDGFHGDGTDWYELELSSELAVQLREALAESKSIKRVDRIQRLDAAPRWWPRKWTADIKFYEKGQIYLAISDTDNRAWFLRIRY